MTVLDTIKKKPDWAIALILSIVYFISFTLVDKGFLKPGLLFGFCVYGSPENPTESTGCSNCKGQNSHIYAFGIDVFMTILALVFWLLDKKKKTLVYFASGFIILAHGILHWFLQQETLKVQVNCYDPNLGADIEGLGYILFGAFSFFLGLVILGFGFGLQLSVVAGSAVFAGIVINVTKSTGGELVLPGLFCIVHPLSCFTGLFSNKPAFNTTVAKLFVVCTIVGIVELTSCTDILKPIGGHLWYDLTLHAAVLAALPYFWKTKQD